MNSRTILRSARTHLISIEFSFQLGNHYYECSLCRAKSTRKDNIRRHVRNLHAETGVDVQTILDEIFRKYSERNKQTDGDNSDAKREKRTEGNTGKLKTTTALTVQEPCQRDVGQQIRNSSISVIKFVGKASAPIDLVTEESRSINLKSDLLTPDAGSARNIICNAEPETAPDFNTFECGVEMPTYQPLTLDPIPQMEPLPLLKTRNNSNLSVYRQLLSPYLRRAH